MYICFGQSKQGALSFWVEQPLVTNAVWVCEALNNLGCTVSSEDSRIKVALNVFFQRYVESLELRPHAKKLLRRIKEQYKLGLVLNFTYAPVFYASLRNWA